MSERESESHSYEDLAGQLITDGENYAKAKVEVYRRLALLRVAQVRNAALFGMGGAVFLHLALFVMLVGILMAIGESSLGYIWATVIVTGVTMLLGVVLLLMARGAFPDFSESPLDAPLEPQEKSRS